MFSKSFIAALFLVSQTLAVPLDIRPIGDGPQHHKDAINQGLGNANHKIGKMHSIIHGPDPQKHPAVIEGFGHNANIPEIKKTVNNLHSGRIMVPHAEVDHRTSLGLADGKKVTFGANFYDKGTSADLRGGTIIHEASHALGGAVDHFDQHGNPHKSTADAKDASGRWKSTTQFGYADSHLGNLKATASHNMHHNADSYRVFGDACARYRRELFTRAFEEDDLEVREDLISRAAAACEWKPKPKADAAKTDGKKTAAHAEKKATPGAAKKTTGAAKTSSKTPSTGAKKTTGAAKTSSKKAPSTAAKKTTGATKKTTGAAKTSAKKTPSTGAKKTTGAAKKTTGAAKTSSKKAPSTAAKKTTGAAKKTTGAPKASSKKTPSTAAKKTTGAAKPAAKKSTGAAKPAAKKSTGAAKPAAKKAPSTGPKAQQKPASKGAVKSTDKGPAAKTPAKAQQKPAAKTPAKAQAKPAAPKAQPKAAAKAAPAKPAVKAAAPAKAAAPKAPAPKAPAPKAPAPKAAPPKGKK